MCNGDWKERSREAALYTLYMLSDSRIYILLIAVEQSVFIFARRLKLSNPDLKIVVADIIAFVCHTVTQPALAHNWFGCSDVDHTYSRATQSSDGAVYWLPCISVPKIRTETLTPPI